MIVTYIGRTLTQQIRMGIYSFHDTCQYQQELNIFIGGLAGLQKVYTIVRSDGPVVMLTGTVYSGKRLLMQHAAQTVLACHTLQSLHYQLVGIHCHIGRLVDGRHFMLCGSRLIMLGLGCYTQLPQLDIDIMHETTDTLTDNTEIVVIHLLSLGGGSTEQGSSGENNIFTLQSLGRIYQEIFLLRANGRQYFGSFCIAEQADDTDRLLAQSLHGTK